MPWCPQCRAEYVEGIATCRACGVALADAPPPPPPPPVPRVAPILTRVRALTYARDAFRLLRRRPALLLLPVAIAVFNAAESSVGSYLTMSRTALGREWTQLKTEQRRPNRELSVVLRAELSLQGLADRFTSEAPLTFASPIPHPELFGLQGLVGAAVTPAGRQDFEIRPGWRLFVPLSLLLVVLPLAAVVLSGYYGRLLEAATGAAPPGLALGRYARRWFVRFLWYLVLGCVIQLIPFLVFSSVSGPSELSVRLLASYSLWAPRIVGVLLALTPVAIVMDDAPFLRALRRGIHSVVRGWITALVLLAMLAVACAVPVILTGALGALYSRVPDLPPTPASTLASAIVHGVRHALLAVIGVWLALAQFLWYREANPAPVAAEEAAETTPA